MSYTVKQITEENVKEYECILRPENAENIGRKFYRALALHDGEEMVKATVLWKIKGDGISADPEAELLQFDGKEVQAAQAILEAFGQAAMEEGITRTFFEFPADKKEAEILALKEAGYLIREAESRELLITAGELAKLPVMGKLLINNSVKSIGSMSLQQFRKGITECLYYKKNGDLEDLSLLPLSWFEADISCATVQDGVVNGMLLLHKNSIGELCVKLMFGNSRTNKSDFIRMIQFSILEITKKYHADTVIRVKCCDEETKAFAGTLFQKKKGNTILYGER